MNRDELCLMCTDAYSFVFKLYKIYFNALYTRFSMRKTYERVVFMNRDEVCLICTYAYKLSLFLKGQRFKFTLF
jgi:hypothetical protein